MSIWFVEGPPGAGKTTLAKQLCILAREDGYKAQWYLEESADHPVHPRTLVTQRHAGDFPRACLQAWANFVVHCRNQDGIHILEGSAFQSTVRFMMEERMPDIARYYQQFAEIVASLDARMVCLRPSDPLEHSRYVCAHRGKEWSDKVSRYLEKTAHARSRGQTGLEGMHAFWAEYATLCDELAASTAFPIKVIEFVPGEWERHCAEAAEFFGLRSCRVVEVQELKVSRDIGCI